MDIQKERELFNKEFGIDDADTFPAFSGGIENSAALKCNWLGWKKRAEFEYRENPETIEIDGLKTIHKLCKFADEHNMEGCSFTEIVERMFDELAKAQAVPEWISVKDKLPDIGVYVMVFLGKQGHNPTTYNFCQYTKFGFHLSNVTHWMPLPDAPQEPK